MGATVGRCPVERTGAMPFAVELRHNGVLRSSLASSSGASSCAWFVTLGGLPGTQAGPPGGYRAPIGLVVLAEAAREGGLLIQADEPRDEQPRCCGVQQQTEPAQEQRLADDGRQYGDIHRVADVAVHPADDQTLWRGDRCRCPEALHDETHERPNQRDKSCDEQYPPEHSHGRPVRQGLARLPTPRQQPRYQARNHARSRQEEHRAAHRGCWSAHSYASLSGSLGYLIELLPTPKEFAASDVVTYKPIH